MNPVDHPMGGGEGRTSGGRHPCSPWGQLSKGLKTRNNKRTDGMIIKRRGQIWIRIFPDKPITKKPAETRMGTGKGAPEYWVASVGAGRMLYEMRGVDEATAREAFRLASAKLSVATMFVKRQVR